MKTTRENKVEEVVKEIRNLISKSSSSIGNIKSEIVVEGRLITIMCDRPWIGPRKYIDSMDEEYNYQLDIDKLIRILKLKRLGHPNARREVADWAKEGSILFERAIKGDKRSYMDINAKVKSPAFESGKWLRCQEKVLLTMIAIRNPEIISEKDLSNINTLSDVRAKFLLFDILDAISNEYMFDVENKRPELSYEEAIRKISYLESRMERTGNMLEELQNEFDEQLKDAKVKELTDFFERLNSDRYGCILDELLSTRRGINVLQKSGYIPPIEINGLFIVIKKLVQFVRDSHIEPVMKFNAVIDVKASDIEFCNYDGTPFESEEEVKKVRVISPGWIYTDEDVQISRPKLKEEK